MGFMNTDLTPLEQHILARSGDSAVTRRRRLSVIVSGFAFAAALVAAALLSPSQGLVLGVALVYIAITVWERVAYANTVLAYKSLVRKLKTQLDAASQH